MLDRLKLCYLYAYNSNPQLELCKDVDSIPVGVLCIVSAIIILQAASRSFIHNKELMFPCNGSSDYEWSIWIILGTQIATILIGSIGASFRLFTLLNRVNMDSAGMTWADKDADVIDENPLLVGHIKDDLIVIIMRLMYLVIACIHLLIDVPLFVIGAILSACFGGLCESREKNIDEIREFSHLIHEDEQGLDEWTLRKSVKEMKKWMALYRNNAPMHSTKVLLSKCFSLEEPLINQLKDFANRSKAYEVSSLSMVLVARIATVCKDFSPGDFVCIVLSEIFEVIHFVERKMNSTSFENKKKSKFAKAALEGPSSRGYLLRVAGVICNGAVLPPNCNVDQAIATIGRLKDALPSDLVREELGIIIDFIKRRNYKSIQELYDYIEQLFVAMLNEFLSQLPSAIYKEIIESNPKDYEEVIRFSLKLLCKVESLEAFVQWSYPIGANINNLITNSNVE
ncbi:hypothetical protein Syun_005921 [Stephania yunnanensis]|uniref:Uncharacterized protein n=1 Tax=Stephania yunnanensis TaxID=152371 RepID=A0AAP0PY42_9MAGN